MAKSIQHGEVISVTAPYAVVSGDGCLVGSLFGVANTTAAISTAVELTRLGVFPITALTTDTAVVGAKAYWDNTNRRITTTVGTNVLVGVFTFVKLNGEVVSAILLDGTVR